MENQYIQKISNTNNINYIKNNTCNCCKCITSFCYCSCQCKCHNDIMKSGNNNINYDELPNLNINELRMKSLNEYTSRNTLCNTKKILNSSRSMYNIENFRMNENNDMKFYTLQKRNKNDLINFKNLYLNKSLEENYFSNHKKLNIINNSFSDRLNQYNTLNDHYKTQSNFNNLRKYYQLNKNNKKVHNLNNTFKTQLKLNKLLSNIKNEETNIKNKKKKIPNIMYNTHVERESSFPSKMNNSEKNLNNMINNSENLNKNFLDNGFNSEYNQRFRSLNFNNKSIDFNEENIVLRKDNKNLTLDKNSNSLSNNFIKYLDSNNIYQNGGGDNQYISYLSDKNNIINKDEINEEQKINNNRYKNRLNIKYLNSLELSSINNSNNLNNSINSAHKDINAINKSESINLNIKNNYPRTSLSTQIENNKNELLESRDINSDNFILTFGAKGNNGIKNIIASVKNELNSKINKVNGKINSDVNINNIINDYENLKKKYSPNRLFTGLQNNINDMNNKINNIQEKSIKNNQNNLSITKNSITIKGQINKNQNIDEINDLKIELKEAKNKMDELTKIIIDYQKEINLLKGQIIKLNRDSIDNSKINTINNISTSNNNSNKTKIGKDSFIIKIPESLIKRRMNKDNNSRNNYSNKMSNRQIKNMEYNESNTLLDLTNNTYKKILFKNNSNNFNNISNISNNSNSNCLTNNNISNNNISNYTNEIYSKKIINTKKKKMKKSASQKIRINRLNQNLYVKPIDSKRGSKFIYTIIAKDDSVELLSFDVIKHRFYIINFIDFDNFENDFKESYNNSGGENKSIFLNIEKNNNFYIVTGKNCDKLYKYNNETNCIKKLCEFKNNHSNGYLLYINDRIICLSGNHNKKVEAFSEKNNSLIILPEMNIERSNFSSCLIKNKFIFVLFGYNFPTQQYLDSIEFYILSEFENYKHNYININDNEWRFLKFNNALNLAIKGHLSFNYCDEKIIFFGGFDGYNNEVVDCIYQLYLPENLNLKENNEDIYIEPLGKKLTFTNENKTYYFENNTGILFNYKRNNMLLFAFDKNFNAHIIDTNNFKHNIHYFK